ncbi:unnamed protein product [Phytophthora lilii]|uniref:Unnamed protein product n=1 Tax=Phytophthora lilii TaxID=2077276 RepID=A0A9W6WW98_9STRA|nr:unnamed protein product [Phytophthora lilii]
MTNAAQRQKVNNGKANGKNTAPAANANANANANGNASAPVKPASAKATATTVQAAKVAATVEAAPTREVSSAGKKNNANAAKNFNKNANATSAKPFALTDVSPSNVQRARQIRKTDFERFEKLHNFFVANDETTARAINGKANAKREQVDQWVRGAVNPKALA